MKQSIRLNAVATAIAAAFGTAAAPACAQLPSGATVVHGTAGIATDGNRMTVTNSANAVLDWQAFSIGAPNSVRFEQPSASSQVLNRVVGNDPSNILGSLSSNGGVWLVNPHGVLFGSNARIDVAGLVASSLGISNDDFLAGRFRFDGSGLPAGQVLNRGELHTSFGGHVWLVGGSVSNEGLIRSPGGSIVLAAGKSIELVDSGAPNVAVRVAAPENEALNLGTLLAPGGGSIDIHGGIVNQQGIVRADSVGADAAGRVVIRALGDIHMGAASETSTSAAGSGAGGKLLVESADGDTLVQGRVSAGSGGGSGGQIHLLGMNVGVYGQAAVDASGAAGGGEVLVGGDYQGGNPAVKNAAATWLGPNATVRADATGAGNGGKLVFWGDSVTRVYGTIAARGGPLGGDGGFVETSGHVLDARPGRLDLAAPHGKPGTWLLDPGNIHIDGSSSLEGGGGNDDLPDYGFTSYSDDAKVPASVIKDQLENGTNVIIRTGGGSTQEGDILVESDIVIDPLATGTGRLTLLAHNDIVMRPGVRIAAGVLPLDVILTADTDNNGAGNIRLQDGAQILANGGDVAMTAAKLDMLAGSQVNARSISVSAGEIQMRNAALNAVGVSESESQTAIAANFDAAANGSISMGAGDVALTDSSLSATGSIGISSDHFSFTNTSSSAAMNAAGIWLASDLVELKNARIVSSAFEDAIDISTDRLTNTGSQLSAPNGRWLIHLGRGYTAFPAADLGNLDYKFVQVDADDASPVVDGIGQNGIMMADPFSVQIKVNASRPYDGTTAASFTQALSGNVAGFQVQPRGSSVVLQGSFADKNTGTNKPIAYSDESVPFQLVTASGAPVYWAEQSYVGDIIPKAVSAAGLVAANKVYDATRTATLSGGVSGILPGDSVSLSGATGLFDTKNAGTGKTVTITGGLLSGADAGNYSFSGGATTTADIAPRPITAAGILASDKVYDGTASATLGGGFSEMLPGDALAIGATAALFDSKNAGTGKTVTFSSSVLAGADAANYVLTGPLSTTASITPKPVTIAITGQVQKEYDATANASLGAGQFALNGMIANDAVSVRGPGQGSYDSPNVGQQRQVSTTGAFEISGADAPNYSVGDVRLTGASNIVNASASGNVGIITPATLIYTASPATGEPGLPVSGLSGTVTGFKGSDTLASATSGTLAWQSSTSLLSPPGAYAIEGRGLSALNYRFVQAPGNASALAMKFNFSPAKPQLQAQESSVQAVGTALRSAILAAAARSSGGGVFDRSGPAAARTFAAVRIGSMNQDELAQMLAARREFKRKLFADAIYKLEIDPSLADVQPCASIADAGSGACRLTPAQVELIHATKRPAPAAVKSASGRVAVLPQIERKVVVLFGINDYQDKTIPQLENAVPDVDAVSRIFADKLGYEVRVVRNPDKAEIIRTLNGLAAEMNSADSVVIYYAGHGYSLEKNGAGYWIPSDAKASDPHGWISNSDVAKALASISAKQMALISDSCYSGAFARDGMDAVGHDVTVADVLAKRSVLVLSSGGDEPVADEGKEGHSIFAWNLMQVVGAVTDWKPGSTVFTNVQAGVKKEFPQTPKYGSVTAAGHQAGGEYLFELR
jgi:filamentous hemagglutinin family protein